MNILILKFSLAILTCLFLLYCHVRYQSNVIPIQPEPQKPPVEKRWVLAILLVCIIFYAFLAYVISLAWLQGDEFLFVHKGNDILYRLMKGLQGWRNYNARFGDIAGHIITLSENRWQQYIITPFFIICTPFAIYALILPSGERIFSQKGFLFVVFIISIFISSRTRTWSSFWNFALCINYLWPSVIICYFLSFYKNESIIFYRNRQLLSKFLTIFLFFIGIYCGWSLECVTLFLLPSTIIWLLLRYKDNEYVPHYCLSATMGITLGAFCLLSSPALASRGVNELLHRALNIQSLSTSEKLAFALNHSAENMLQLKGITVNYYLGDLPLWMHLFYLPELLNTFISSCKPILLVCIFLAICCFKTKTKQLYITFWGNISLSLCMACSYIYAGIPGVRAFFPPTVVLLVLAGYLFIYISCKHALLIRIAVCIFTVSYSLTEILPSTLEAREYKKYEHIRHDKIQEQVSQGILDVVLPPPYATPPKDKLGLIAADSLKDNHKDWPNYLVPSIFGAKSIIQQKLNPSN